MLVPQAYAGPAPPVKDEWILTQEHPDSGRLFVYIAPKAVKIVSIKRGFEILASAPDWLVHSFRRQDKLMFTTKLSTFTSLAMVSPFGDTKLKPSHYAVTRTGSLKGLKYTQYEQGSQLNNHVVWGADDIPVDKHVCEFLCRYYYMPAMDTVPLYEHAKHTLAHIAMETVPTRKSDHPWFDTESLNEHHDARAGITVKMTTSAWRKVPYNASDFELPTGFAIAKDAKQVMVSGSQKKQIEEMFDSIGFTSDLMRKDTGEGKSKQK